MKKLVFLMLATLWAVTSWGGVTPTNGGSYVMYCVNADMFVGIPTSTTGNILAVDAADAATLTFEADGEKWKIKTTNGYLHHGSNNWACDQNATEGISWTIEETAEGSGLYRFKRDYANTDANRSGWEYLAPNYNFLEAGQTDKNIYTDKPNNNNEGRYTVFGLYASVLDCYKEQLQTAINAVDNGSGVGQYSAATAIATAQAAHDATDATVESLKAAKTALNEAIAALTPNMPDANKYYRIVNSIPAFNKGKSIYNDGTKLRWHSWAESDRASYWQFVPVDGGYKLYNPLYQTYVAAAGTSQSETFATNTEEAGVFTLVFLGGAQFNLRAKDATHPMHAKNHSEGTGNNGDIITWDGAMNSASGWYIEEVTVTSPVNYTLTVSGTDTPDVKYGDDALTVGTNSLPFFVKTADFTANVVDGTTSVLSCNFDEAHNIIHVTYNKYLASLPLNWTIHKGTATGEITPATNENDNAHWYILTQDRSGESPLYDNAEQLMRAGNDDIDGQQVNDHQNYLVRFFNTDHTGVYKVQLGTGNYVSAPSDAPGQGAALPVAASGRDFFFYPTTTGGTVFGWNLTTDGTTKGKKVDNNGKGAQLSYWDAGNITETTGNNVWKVYPVTFTANIPYTLAKDYGTLILPFAWTAPSGWNVYSCNSKEGNTLSLEEVTAPAANTPYIIGGTNHEAQTFQGTVVTTTDPLTAGYLTGVYAQTPAPDNSFVLQEQQGVLGFYQVQDTKPAVGANRCYLTLPADAAGVKALFFGTATGIEKMQNAECTMQNGAVYDLAGRRVSKPQHGIYIINGKKVIR